MIDERMIATDYSDEMKKSFIDYAMSVIVDRALPDVRDGLKPVHRRILYSMYESGFTPDKPHRKSVATVGEVMKKYHPHGDMSIYDALVRMAQDFSLAHPLVDGHGNFGSIDGDPPAAFRYTEARLREVALEVIGDTEHDTVDFIPNFDGREMQPLVLPSRFPNLLVNGTTGIAVGMATNMPPHNLVEVIKAVFEYIDNPDITVARLMKHIKGPDFPTGGIICNPDVLAEIYETGTSSGGLDENGRKGKRKNSSIRIRSKVEVENIGNGKTNLVVTEIPYTWSGSKDKFKEKIIDLVKNGELSELSEVRDESGREGIRIVLEVKKGIDIDNLLNKLYKKTPIEDTMSVNFLALVPDKSDPHKLKPEVLNLKELIRHYVDFQKEITTRKYRYLLPKEKDRKEILEGMIRAHDVIDLIIEVIRGSKDVKSVKHCLVTGDTTGIALKTKKSEKEAARLNFTEKQADAILAMQLQRLVGIELQRLHEEHREVCRRIADYENILGNESALIGVIKGYLNEMRKNYGQRRKTVIEEHPVAEYMEDVMMEELVVLIDKFGYAKTVDAAVFNRANGEAAKDFRHILPCANTDKVCIFTREGNLYQVKVADLPRGRIKDKGIPLDTLAGYGKETCLFIEPFGHIRDQTMIFTTRHGMMKCIGGVEFESNRSQISSTKLNDGDELVDIRLAGACKEITCSMNFKKQRPNPPFFFEKEQVISLRRLSISPKGMGPASGTVAERKTTGIANIDEIVGTQAAETTHVVLLTGRGYLLKFPLCEVPVMKKTSKGVKAIALVKEDTVCGLFLLAKNEERIEPLNGREINLSRMKTKKRNQIGVKT